jgi:hypothetical protein
VAALAVLAAGAVGAMGLATKKVRARKAIALGVFILLVRVELDSIAACHRKIFAIVCVQSSLFSCLYDELLCGAVLGVACQTLCVFCALVINDGSLFQTSRRETKDVSDYACDCGINVAVLSRGSPFSNLVMLPMVVAAMFSKASRVKKAW